MEEKLSHERIIGPEQLQYVPGHPGRRVSTPDEYLGWHSAVVLAREGVPWDTDRKVTARVNHGKWIADCAWCKAGMLTRPEWGVAYCVECGARYGKALVIFPKFPKDVEAPLLERVMRRQQNWDNRQGPAELKEENERDEVITFRKEIEKKTRKDELGASSEGTNQ